MDQAAPDGSTQSPHPASPEHLHAEEQLTQRLEALLHRSEAAHLRVPAWLRPTSPENRLPVAVAILVVIALQLALPDHYALQPRPLAPTLELLLLAVLVGINPVRLTRASRLSRVMSIILVAAISTQNIIATVSLASAILRGQTGQDAVGLLGSGAAVFATNIIAFGVWYWELDRGGPFARAAGTSFAAYHVRDASSQPSMQPWNSGRAGVANPR